MSLAAGYFVPLTAIGISFPLRIKMVGKKLLVDFSFRDLSNARVAKMHENEWDLGNEGNFYDRNYDSTGFEVIDREDITKFQIEFLDSTTIKIGGVIQDNNSVYFISEEGSIQFNKKKISKETVINKSEQIPTLFRYPSKKYFGKRQK